MASFYKQIPFVTQQIWGFRIVDFKWRRHPSQPRVWMRGWRCFPADAALGARAFAGAVAGTRENFCRRWRLSLRKHSTPTPKSMTRKKSNHRATKSLYLLFWMPIHSRLKDHSKPSTSFEASRYENLIVPLKANFTLGVSRNSQRFPGFLVWTLQLRPFLPAEE